MLDLLLMCPGCWCSHQAGVCTCMHTLSRHTHLCPQHQVVHEPCCWLADDDALVLVRPTGVGRQRVWNSQHGSAGWWCLWGEEERAAAGSPAVDCGSLWRSCVRAAAGLASHCVWGTQLPHWWLPQSLSAVTQLGPQGGCKLGEEQQKI